MNRVYFFSRPTDCCRELLSLLKINTRYYDGNVLGGNNFLSLYDAVGLVVFSPIRRARDRVTGDDKMHCMHSRVGDHHDKITNSSIRRVVKCKCMRVPPLNVLGKLFLHIYVYTYTRAYVRTSSACDECK